MAAGRSRLRINGGIGLIFRTAEGFPAKTPKLVLADLDAIYAGSYRCVITDGDGKPLHQIMCHNSLKRGIEIVTQPQDQRKKAGEYATLMLKQPAVT